METLIHDLRYAIRTLIMNPGFAGVAVLTLGLGIGANTAIFSVVNAVLLTPLPYRDAGRLVSVYQRTQGGSYNVFSAPNYIAWREHAQAFQSLAVYTSKSYNLAGATEVEHITGQPVTASLFPLFGVNPVLGRTFEAQEDLPGGPKVVVLSYPFWQKHYAGARSVIGSTLKLDGEGYTVLGVMPGGFQIAQSAGEFWVPLQLNPADPRSSARGLHWLFGLGRLKSGMTFSQTEAEANSLAPQLAKEYPQTDAGYGLQLVPLLDDVVGNVRPVLQVLLASVGLVLLIACVNVANLLLARATGRQREMALRAVLGASRARVIRQLLTESVLLALIGGALGLILAFNAVRLLASLTPSGSLPRIESIAVDSRALAFTLIATIVTGLAFGLVPALQASKCSLNEALKESGRGADTSRRRRRLRSALVISEVAVALMLLIGAGLMVVSFKRLQDVNPGFDPRHVLSLRVSLPADKVSGERLDSFRRRLIEGAAALPGVESAALTRNLPLSGTDPSLFFTIPGQPPVAPGQEPIARARFVSPGFFHTLNIPIRKGRDFTGQDGAAAPGVVIISETMARQFWPGQDPIGKQMKPGYPASSLVCTVVGVAGDVRHWLSIEEPPVAYYPYSQIPASYVPLLENYFTLTMRTAGDPESLVAAVRQEIHTLDPDLPVYEVQTMDHLVREAAADNRFQMLLFGVFAGVGLVLAAVGIYGVISYSVTQRTHEIGIRLALGAKRGEVLKLIVSDGMRLALAGAVLGLAGALGLSRFLGGLLYGVKATDPATFAVVFLVLTAVALIACYLPARRATKVDPMVALRYE
ncbi:MAG TPA: ABC transporter permease [Terriglobia bacterium]|jgi:putative ABC transport system permease protein|nr:ABC transporter permease [Terriglobia bacterium]